MAYTLAVGTSLQIASAYSAALPFTGATNVAETVLAMASTAGFSAGDFVELTSAWGLMSGRVPRIKTVVANTSITLEGLDTSDTSMFPGAPTGAVGTVRKITQWTALSQLTRQFNIGGGAQQFSDVSTLDDRVLKQIPTVRDPITAEFGAYFDASLTWVPIVKAVSDASNQAAFRLVYPNQGRTVGNAFWSMSDMPTIEDNTLRTKINLAISSLPFTYAN